MKIKKQYIAAFTDMINKIPDDVNVTDILIQVCDSKCVTLSMKGIKEATIIPVKTKDDYVWYEIDIPEVSD